MQAKQSPLYTTNDVNACTSKSAASGSWIKKITDANTNRLFIELANFVPRHMPWRFLTTNFWSYSGVAHASMVFKGIVCELQAFRILSHSSKDNVRIGLHSRWKVV